MKKKDLLYTFLLFGLVLVSCKKEKAPEPSTTSTGTAVNTATSWYGIMSHRALQTLSNGSLLGVSYSISAYFSNSPVPAWSPSYAVTVDSVSANSNDLYLAGYYYSGNSIGAVPVAWKVVGNNGIPSFTYTCTSAFPVYAGYSSLPDSIDRSMSVTIPINGISGAGKTTVLLSSGSSYQSATLNPGSTSVTFSQSATSNLNTTSSGRVIVIMEKDDVKALSGKDFNFKTEYQFTKYVKIY
jgi:hypothetical protein